MNYLIFSMYSSWTCRVEFLKEIVSRYQVNLCVVFSDEYEIYEDIDYSISDWYQQVGSIGVLLFYNDISGITVYSGFSEDDEVKHEIFLMSWNGTLPYDGGSEKLFNQKNIKDDYMYDEDGLIDFRDWMRQRVLKEIGFKTVNGR